MKKQYDDMIILAMLCILFVMMIVIIIISLWPMPEVISFSGSFLGALLSGIVAIFVVYVTVKEMRKQTMIGSQPLLQLSLNRDTAKLNYKISLEQKKTKVNEEISDNINNILELSLRNIGNGPAKNISLTIKINEEIRNNIVVEDICLGEERQFKASVFEYEWNYSSIGAGDREIKIDMDSLNRKIREILLIPPRRGTIYFLGSTQRVEFKVMCMYEDLLGNTYEEDVRLYFYVQCATEYELPDGWYDRVLLVRIFLDKFMTPSGVFFHARKEGDAAWPN